MPGLCPDKQGTAGILATFRGGRMANGGGLENHRLLGPPSSGRISGVSVACPGRVTDRRQTRRDVRVATARDGRSERSDGRRVGIEPPRRVPQFPLLTML